MLIQAGADVNMEDNNGGTALMLAVHYGSVEQVCLLIQAGADINVSDNRGRTVLTTTSSEEKSDLSRQAGAVER